ncbi:MAG: sugar phosphate isomerase/epimerase [Acidobacteriota bacterium]
MINRRTFLRDAACSSLGALALAGLSARVAQAAKLSKIGVQLYTVRSQMAKDFEGSLKQIAELGYQEVEFAGYYNRTPQQVKEILGRYGLSAPSAHVPLATVQKDIEKTIEAAKVIGHKLLVCPYLDAKDRTSLDDYKRHAETFSKAGEACRKAGIEFGYHNHDFEFVTMDGKMPFDVLLAGTDAKTVKIELDLYWIAKAKQDALAYLRKHPGRFVAFHVKDMDATPKAFFTEVGRGVINFKELLAQGKKSGVKYYIVEQDQTPGSPFDSLKISIDYLKKLEF